MPVDNNMNEEECVADDTAHGNECGCCDRADTPDGNNPVVMITTEFLMMPLCELCRRETLIKILKSLE